MAHLPVYLADFSMFNAPDELKVDFYKSQEAAWRWKVTKCNRRQQTFASDSKLPAPFCSTHGACYNALSSM